MAVPVGVRFGRCLGLNLGLMAVSTAVSTGFVTTPDQTAAAVGLVVGGNAVLGVGPVVVGLSSWLITSSSLSSYAAVSGRPIGISRSELRLLVLPG